MPNVRPLNPKKYRISKHRFLYVYHYCLQYREWKNELESKTEIVKSPVFSGIPHGSGPGQPTENLALRRAQLRSNMELIEQTCKEADADLYPWLLEAVTNEGIGYVYLRERRGMPCGKKMYYDRRRKFYWLMSQKI